jgi:hypothetical protein
MKYEKAFQIAKHRRHKKKRKKKEGIKVIEDHNLR